jgi:tRNA pseudouridine38-40 synthase
MKYLFEIAYKGTNYHGWQRQLNSISVQEVVEEALTKLLRQETTILASGRTDAGVHCEQQFFHVERETPFVDLDKLIYQLNHYLPGDISISNARHIADDAHARFSPLSRSYTYRMVTTKDPFTPELTYFFDRPLNIKTMNEAAALLIGKKDFESFSRVKTEVNNFFCDISEANWVQQGNQITFYITANRFLRGMVRAIVGTLISVGMGKTTVKEFEEIINAKNRRKAGSSARAHGLFLTKVIYPQDIFIN